MEQKIPLIIEYIQNCIRNEITRLDICGGSKSVLELYYQNPEIIKLDAMLYFDKTHVLTSTGVVQLKDFSELKSDELFNLNISLSTTDLIKYKIALGVNKVLQYDNISIICMYDFILRYIDKLMETLYD